MGPIIHNKESKGLLVFREAKATLQGLIWYNLLTGRRKFIVSLSDAGPSLMSEIFSFIALNAVLPP